METLRAAVEAASEQCGGRPLQWREWRRMLTELGDTLTAAEVERLERVLVSQGEGEQAPSMKLLLDAVEAQQCECRRLRAMVQWSLDSEECRTLSGRESVRGCVVMDASVQDGFGPQRCTQYCLTVPDPGAVCRLQLRVDFSDRDDQQHCRPRVLLLVMNGNDMQTRPLAVARVDASGVLTVDARFPAGQFCVTPLLLPPCVDSPTDRALSSSAAAPEAVLFTVDPASDGGGGAVRLTDAYRRELRWLFRVWDWDDCGALNRSQFSALNALTTGEPVQDEEWQIVLSHFATDSDGRLTEPGFMQLHQMEAEDNAGRPEELWSSLLALGYDRQLVARRLASFRLQLFSDRAARLQRPPQLVELSDECVRHQLRALCAAGERPGAGWRRLLLDHCVLVLFANLSVDRRPLTATVDWSAALNCRPALPGSVVVPPGACALVQCLVRVDLAESWKPTVSVSTSPD